MRRSRKRRSRSRRLRLRRVECPICAEGSGKPPGHVGRHKGPVRGTEGGSVASSSTYAPSVGSASSRSDFDDSLYDPSSGSSVSASSSGSAAAAPDQVPVPATEAAPEAEEVEVVSAREQDDVLKMLKELRGLCEWRLKKQLSPEQTSKYQRVLARAIDYIAKLRGGDIPSDKLGEMLLPGIKIVLDARTHKVMLRYTYENLLQQEDVKKLKWDQKKNSGRRLVPFLLLAPYLIPGASSMTELIQEWEIESRKAFKGCIGVLGQIRETASEELALVRAEKELADASKELAELENQAPAMFREIAGTVTEEMLGSEYYKYLEEAEATLDYLEVYGDYHKTWAELDARVDKLHATTAALKKSLGYGKGKGKWETLVAQGKKCKGVINELFLGKEL